MLFPPKCMFCRKIIDKGNTCNECAKTLLHENINIKPPQFIDKVYAPFYYKGSVRQAIIRYKFSRTTAYAEPFAKFMAQVMKDKVNADFITWVPISRRRLRTRGFDQSRLVAEYLSKELNLPLIETLKKVRHNKRQSMMKNSAARRANVVGAYEIIDAGRIFLRKVLLVDDILTTGATLSEAARMLKTAGVLDINVAVIAKTKKSN